MLHVDYTLCEDDYFANRKRSKKNLWALLPSVQFTKVMKDGTDVFNGERDREERVTE